MKDVKSQAWHGMVIRVFLVLLLWIVVLLFVYGAADRSAPAANKGSVSTPTAY